MPKVSGDLAPDVFDLLVSYPWPGNVRELRNEIRQSCALVEEGPDSRDGFADLRIQMHHFSSQITRESK